MPATVPIAACSEELFKVTYSETQIAMFNPCLAQHSDVKIILFQIQLLSPFLSLNIV